MAITVNRRVGAASLNTSTANAAGPRERDGEFGGSGRFGKGDGRTGEAGRANDQLRLLAVRPIDAEAAPGIVEAMLMGSAGADRERTRGGREPRFGIVSGF